MKLPDGITLPNADISIYILLESVIRDCAITALNTENATTGSAKAISRNILRRYSMPLTCEECNGTGRTDNHVTGEVECSSCNGTGI